jgi:hypothetical protein
MKDLREISRRWREGGVLYRVFTAGECVVLISTLLWLLRLSVWGRVHPATDPVIGPGTILITLVWLLPPALMSFIA